MNRHKRPTTILYLDYTNQIGLGGGQRSLSLLVRHLDAGRYRAVIGCPPGERLTGLLPADTTVFPVPLRERFRAVSRYESSWRRLPGALASCREAIAAIREAIRRERVELIHANNLKMLWLAAMATRRRLPLVWHVRDIFPPGRVAGASVRVAAALATHVVAVSHAVRRQFADSPKSSVIHNAVELPDIARSVPAGREFRKRHGIPESAAVVGSAGRLAACKGLDTLLQAFSLIHPGDPRLHLAIVGEGPERARLQSLAAALEVDRAVHFIPYQSEMGPAWSAMDIVAVPSAEPDSFPRSVIEAMSFGKPVLGSRTGGIVEAIEEEITGYCFEPGDRDGLAGKLRGLLEQPRLAADMGRRARLHCERLFSVETQSRRVSALYEMLLGRSSDALAA